jgi:hypothetical protein
MYESGIVYNYRKNISSQRRHVSLFLPFFYFFRSSSIHTHVLSIFSSFFIFGFFFPLFCNTATHVLSIFSSFFFFGFFPPLFCNTPTHVLSIFSSIPNTHSRVLIHTHIPLPRQLCWGYFGHAVRLSAANPRAPVRAQGPATAHELGSCDARPPHAQRHRPLCSRPYLTSFDERRMKSEYTVSEPYGFSLVLRFYCFRARAPLITYL